MNDWLAVAPNAQIAHGMTAVGVSLNDQANRAPRALTHNEVIDLGGRRVRYLDTPHVPHGWEAGLMFEETTGTLLCGDLFTQYGECDATTESDIVGAAIASEDIANFSALNPAMGATLRKLAELKPRTLALMHGPSFQGDGAAALMALGHDYDRRLLARARDLGLTATQAA
jgi:flavorubredoxin